MLQIVSLNKLVHHLKLINLFVSLSENSQFKSYYVFPESFDLFDELSMEF